MNLSTTQIKDTYGNLVTIGSVAGTPTTGTLQNGAGSDLTSITLNGAAVFNEGGGDFDFRVEGQGDANLLFVDASTAQVGIGTNAPAAKLDIRTADGATVRIGSTSGSLTQDSLIGAVDFFNSDTSGNGPQVAAAVRAYRYSGAGGGGYLTLNFAPADTGDEGQDAKEVFRLFQTSSATPNDGNVSMALGGGVTSATPAPLFTLQGTGGSGTDISGTTLVFQAGRPTGAGAGGELRFETAAAGASGTTLRSASERMRITSAGNVKIGGTADRATTEGTAQLVLFDGTAPVGTLANGVSFYSASGEANVMDAAGNATLLSPHDKDTNEWIFRSKHTPTGKVLKIDVERMLRFINDHFGLDMIEEFTEA